MKPCLALLKKAGHHGRLNCGVMVDSMVKIGVVWKFLLLPVFYYLSNLTYNTVFSMLGIEMVFPDRVEKFLLISAVVLTALMVWGAFLIALNQAKAQSSH